MTARIDNEPGSSTRPTQVDGEPSCKICPACAARYSADFQNCPEDGHKLIEEASEEHDDNLVGQVVKDTYVFARILGEGAMARVYEASHTRLRGKRFAIKVLHPEFCVYKEVLQRFRREAEAAAAIDSRHIIEVYDVDDTPDGRPFMVTEKLVGIELGDHVAARGVLPMPTAISICRQLCKALDAAHKAGIIHRDMKPENVFLVGDIESPFVKVIDFGISKDGNRPGTQLTRTGSVMGTPSFMAPEQAKGLPVTHATDIYAVGGILFNLLTGQRPFDGEHPAEILTALLTTDLRSPRSLNPQIPAGLEAVILKAMSKEPADRYPTARLLDQALESVSLTPAPSPAETAPWSEGPEITVSEEPSPPSITLSDPPLGLPDLGRARTSLILSSVLAVLLASGVLVSLANSIMRLSGERGLGAGGVAATVGAALLILSTPAVLLILHVKKNAWQDEVRVSEMATRLRSPALAGASAFAGVWLLARMASAIAANRKDVVEPAWELVACLLGFGVGVAWAVMGRKPR